MEIEPKYRDFLKIFMDDESTRQWMIATGLIPATKPCSNGHCEAAEKEMKIIKMMLTMRKMMTHLLLELEMVKVHLNTLIKLR